MNRWTSVCLLCLSACLEQQPEAPLRTSVPKGFETDFHVAPGTPVVLQSEEAEESIELVLPARPQFSATSTATASPIGASQVSLVRQVVVAFELRGAGAPHRAAVEFLDPNGAPYLREERVLEGTRFDVNHLEFALPVAATAIDANAMTGVWTAHLWVDGEEVTTQRFELTR